MHISQYESSKSCVLAWQVPAAAAAVVPAGKSPLIQGLKHKILVHLLMKKQQEAAAGNHEALKQFHYVFETYVNLLMWKVALSISICGLHALKV